jgi:hypothetical protein
MTLKREPKYTSRRAYVLKMRSDAQPGELAGRLENLVTGHQVEFLSAPELIASLARDLELIGDEPAVYPTSE